MIKGNSTVQFCRAKSHSR